MITDETHYLALAAAYARGALGIDADDVTALARAGDANLELQRFKRSAQLPRVRAVLGALRGFSPERLIDLGSGRGVFVWPLLDAIRELVVTATDTLSHRAQLYAHVARGGIARVAGVRADVTALPFADRSADCVTALEVLEHLPGKGPEQAAAEAFRVARVAVIASVPSKEDDNPDHHHVLEPARITAMFRAAGAKRVAIDYVPGHLIAVVTR